MLEVGLKGEVSKVAAEDTAAREASGLLEVFSTPMMIALMEKAAYTLAEEHLKRENYCRSGNRFQTYESNSHWSY